jgi:quinol monooxygenase YgiN
MHKIALSFTALGALTMPAYAQAPQHGEKTGYIATTYTAEVLPGQMDKFKQLAAGIIAATAKEPGTLIYEWNMRADGKTFDVVELYQSSDALIAHVNHVVPEFGKALGETQKTTGFVIFGAPNEAAKKAIAGFNPTYTTPIDGFIR